MAGAVGAAARGVIEAGEGGGRQPQADLAGSQGVEGGRGVIWDLAAFHKGKAVGALPRRLEAEGKVSSLVGWHHIRQAWNALSS